MPASAERDTAIPMKITVIICTRNRAEQLRRTLESAAAMESPGHATWELLVVDNGSTDHTPQVVESFSGRLPVRCVSEPTAGLSNARNRGIAEAGGEYICWTDDDVLVDPHWLAAYAEAFARHPEAAYFGGPIDLLLEGSRPAWFNDNRALLGAILAERQLGDAPIRFDLDADVIPYGANYAVRTREQRAHTYDPRLGVSPTQRRLGEETTVIAAIDDAGGTGWWVPGARVLHIIPAERQTLEYFGQYRRAAGETAAYLAEHGPPSVRRRSMPLSGRSFRGAPLDLWLLRTGSLMMHRLLRLSGRLSASLPHFLRYSYYDGAISYCRARLRKPDEA